MGCFKIGSNEDEFGEDKLIINHFFKEEYNVDLNYVHWKTGKLVASHAESLHVDRAVSEQEERLEKGEITRKPGIHGEPAATQFSSREDLNLARDYFLDKFKEEMSDPSTKDSIAKTIEIPDIYGEGIIQSEEGQFLSVDRISKCTFVYDYHFDDKVWREKTIYPDFGKTYQEK